MNESSVTKRCCYVSSTFFKWVYGNPLTFLVGIRRIPAYHVDYTTGCVGVGVGVGVCVCVNTTPWTQHGQHRKAHLWLF